MCCWKRVFAMTSACSWQNSVSLCPASFCTPVNLPYLFISYFCIPVPYDESEHESRSVMSDSLLPHGFYSSWNSPGKNTGVGSLALLQGNLLKPGIEPRSPTLQAYSLPAELPGKPKNTGVGSLSLLQGIFPTQESDQGLLHCRQILHQLSCDEKDVFSFFFFFCCSF